MKQMGNCSPVSIVLGQWTAAQDPLAINFRLLEESRTTGTQSCLKACWDRLRWVNKWSSPVGISTGNGKEANSLVQTAPWVETH